MYWIFFPVHIPYNYYCHTISTSTINKIIIIILIISTMMAEIILSVTPAANVESTTENTMIKLSNKDFGFLRHHLRREMRKTKRKTNWYGRLARWSSLLYSASVEFEKHVNLPLVSLRETADRLFGDDRSQSSGSRFAWSRSASGSDGIRGKTYEILQTFYENPFMLIKTSGFEMNDDHGLKSLLSSNKRQRKTAPFAQAENVNSQNQQMAGNSLTLIYAIFVLASISIVVTVILYRKYNKLKRQQKLHTNSTANNNANSNKFNNNNDSSKKRRKKRRSKSKRRSPG